MEKSLFHKAKEVLKEREKGREDIADFFLQKVGFSPEKDNILCKGKNCTVRLTSVERMSATLKNIQTLYREEFGGNLTLS